jgi:hypothetical protein
MKTVREKKINVFEKQSLSKSKSYVILKKESEAIIEENQFELDQDWNLGAFPM